MERGLGWGIGVTLRAASDMPPVRVQPIPAQRDVRPVPGVLPLTGRPRATRTDRRLMAGLRRQDHGSTQQLYERLSPSVLGFLTRALPDRHVAEDVLQEVFLEVWRRGPSFDPRRGTLTSWVFVIARSRALDHLRRRVPEPRDPHATEFNGADEESEIDHLLGEWRLTALLSDLPSDEARILSLRFRDGLSQSEIAERTGIPLGTVKMRMVQALERLRVLVDREEGRG